jgi:hypothetical protein
VRTDPGADDGEVAVFVDDVDRRPVIFRLDGSDDFGDAVLDRTALDAERILALEAAPGFSERFLLAEAFFQFVEIENRGINPCKK